MSPLVVVSHQPVSVSSPVVNGEVVVVNVVAAVESTPVVGSGPEVLTAPVDVPDCESVPGFVLSLSLSLSLPVGLASVVDTLVIDSVAVTPAVPVPLSESPQAASTRLAMHTVESRG